ncbi:MAG: NAD-dependent epimerase/dehydratase family protein, partial [Methylococcales bacterium]
MTENRIGVFGAGSLVGERLLLLLAESSARVFAYYRQKHERNETNIEWLCLSYPQPNQHAIHSWFCLAPIWILPDYFSFLEQHQVRRVVALSSTSRFSKLNSSDPEEQVMVKQLIAAEERLQIWAESKAIDWIILRPTLIYGYGRDKNITEIARFIKRFGFFPVFGKAQGLRQPVHAEDVAQACIA